jgi:hypothetical protein
MQINHSSPGGIAPQPQKDVIRNRGAAPPVEIAYRRSVPLAIYRPAGCRSGDRPAARANRVRTFRRHIMRPSRRDRARLSGCNLCTRQSAGLGQRQRCRASARTQHLGKALEHSLYGVGVPTKVPQIERQSVTVELRPTG